MTCGPEMEISPCVPSGTWRPGSSRSRRDMIVPGRGNPMDPSLIGPSGGLTWVTGDVSESPYPSTSLHPETRSNSFFTSRGNGAPPELQNFRDDRSYFLISGAFASALKSVGTPAMIVGFVLSISLNV